MINELYDSHKVERVYMSNVRVFNVLRRGCGTTVKQITKERCFVCSRRDGEINKAKYFGIQLVIQVRMSSAGLNCIMHYFVNK